MNDGRNGVNGGIKGMKKNVSDIITLSSFL